MALAAIAPHMAAGVKFGDAVPAIVKRSDLDRIRRALNIERFSVIAAVLLGATDGRELLIAEPIPEAALDRIVKSCEAGGFCPDPLGFLASRVRVLLLRGAAVDTILIGDGEVRNSSGRLFNPDALGMVGRFIGWNGWAEEGEGHVSVVLSPITIDEEERVGIGADPPFTLRWNADVGRFQLFECRFGEQEGEECRFEGEIEDRSGSRRGIRN